MDYDVADISLAPVGRRKIEWVRKHMPILRGIEKRFSDSKPFTVCVAVSIHFEAKTAYLATVLAAGGAEVSITGSNPLSTRDEAAAALAADGLRVYAHHGASHETYLKHIDKVLDCAPHIVIDDGGDLVHRLHTVRTELLGGILGVCEETTTVLRAMASRRASLRCRSLLSQCLLQTLFDNRYGTGQSVWDYQRTTNFGGRQAGRWPGTAGAARNRHRPWHGCAVTVCEIDPIKAVEAAMEFCGGEDEQACRHGDIFVTARVLRRDRCRHIEQMKDGWCWPTPVISALRSMWRPCSGWRSNRPNNATTSWATRWPTAADQPDRRCRFANIAAGTAIRPRSWT